MSDLNLKLVISGSNDGAILALKQVAAQATASGNAVTRADNPNAFGKTREGVQSISTQLGRLQTLAASAVGGNFLIGLARQAIDAATEMQSVDARLKLATRSWQEYGEALAGVRQIAFESGTAVAANVTLIARISDPIKRLGGLESDVLATVTAVNNSLRITNATTAEGAAAMLQFAQALGSGVLRGDELNSILEQAPRLAQAVADGLGITVGELRNLGAQGALTSEQVFKALKTQQAALAAEAATLPVTVGQAWTNAGEGIKRYVGELDKTTGATASLAGLLNAVAGNIPKIAGGLQDIALVVGVAFGARQIAGLSAYIAAQRERIAVDRITAADLVRQAEVELAVRQAQASKTAQELAGIRVIQSYTLATNEATIAEERRAVAARLAAANQAVTAASSALSVARTAELATGVGVLGRAMGIAAIAGRGLLALFGGPLGLAVTAITVGVLAWEHFSASSKKAVADTKEPIDQLLKNFRDFSGKAGSNEFEDMLTRLRGRAAELRDELQNPAFRKSELGKAAAEDLRKLDAEIDRASQKIKQFNNERGAEKGQLGLDKLKLDVGGLIDQDTLKSLQAFDTLYKDFVDKARKDNGELKVSALEAQAALEKLFSVAKTPADFSSLVARLGDSLKANPGSTSLQSALETAISRRSELEMKALDALASGLEARAQRTQALFAKSANVALAQFSQAAAMAKVAAELNSDTSATSRLDVNGRNAEVAAAVGAANIEIGALEQVAARKRALVNEQRTATALAADDEIAAAKKVRADRLADFEKEVAEGKKTAAQLADYKATLDKNYEAKVSTARASRLQAESDAARRITEIDGKTAEERAAIATTLYEKLKAKASEALASYKSYAQQVISLDKSIQSNRLDTAAAIGALQRSQMSPAEQLSSLRDELSQVQAATAAAKQNGQQENALELLNRQKALVQQIGQLRGDGIDPQAQIQEGVDGLASIGAQAEAILQAQRDTAAKAAAEQLNNYQQMTQAMNGLAQQITALNEQAAIKLKPEIDKDSLNAAITAVKNAFAQVVIPVTVQPSGLPSASTPADGGSLPGRAIGGELPGIAPHDRADNMVYRGTPGEWVIQRPSVRYYGRDFIRAVNEMRLPRFAFGGELGASSAINRLAIPSVSASGSGSAGGPAILDLGALGRIRISSTPNTADDVTAVLKRAALQYGRR